MYMTRPYNNAINLITRSPVCIFFVVAYRPHEIYDRPAALRQSSLGALLLVLGDIAATTRLASIEI